MFKTVMDISYWLNVLYDDNWNMKLGYSHTSTYTPICSLEETGKWPYLSKSRNNIGDRRMLIRRLKQQAVTEIHLSWRETAPAIGRWNKSGLNSFRANNFKVQPKKWYTIIFLHSSTLLDLRWGNKIISSMSSGGATCMQASVFFYHQ